MMLGFFGGIIKTWLWLIVIAYIIAVLAVVAGAEDRQPFCFPVGSAEWMTASAPVGSYLTYYENTETFCWEFDSRIETVEYADTVTCPHCERADKKALRIIKNGLLQLEVEEAQLAMPECGNGPVEITISEPGPCPNSLKCSLAEIAEGVYSRTCVQETSMCYSAHAEKWTDWPQCPDAEQIEEPLQWIPLATDTETNPAWESRRDE